MGGPLQQAGGSAQAPPEPMPAQAGAERRGRLRQYQMQLLERVQAAKTGAAVGGSVLGVLIGQRRCLLELTQISEIVTLQAITPVPLARPWYLGLANIRGALTGVVDLAQFQGRAGGGGADSRLVTIAPSLGFPCALRVERVLGLRKLAGMTALPADADGGNGAAGWCAQRYADGDAQQWDRIDLARLVREPRFLQVGL